MSSPESLSEIKKETASSRHPSLELLDKKDLILMGVVNVTPDSFYDGGKHGTFESACDHARHLIDEGADILDVGGESSRPGSLPVTADEERRRVLPVIEQLRKETGILMSIDTTKAAVAKDALDAGADWINDISAGRFDSEMAPFAAQRMCPVILMHSRNTPETMQVEPVYNDVMQEVINELLVCVKKFTDHGVLRKNIILDPGIGFAKRFEDNIEILRHLSKLLEIGFPILIGTSRKSFIGHILEKGPQQRLYGTLGSVAVAYINGAKIFRVHDVEETKDFLNVLSTIENR